MSEFFRHGLASRLRSAALVVVVALIIVLVFFAPGLGAAPADGVAQQALPAHVASR